MRVILVFSFLYISSTVFAGSYSYECTINGEYTEGKNGKLIQDKKIYLGQTFNVERKSGVVLGGGVGNSSYPTKQILDPGGSEQSYKVIWISSDVVGTNGGKHIGYLSIKEYEEDRLKPFILVKGSRILAGVCE